MGESSTGSETIGRYEQYVKSLDNLRKKCRGEILPIREDAEEISGLPEGQTFKHHRANEIREHKGSPTLTQNMGTGGHNVPMVMNLQSRSADRPSMTRLCDCGSGKLYCKCCGVTGGSGTFGKEDEAYTLDVGCNQGVARCLDANMWKGITPEHYFEKNKRNIVALRSYPRTGTKEQDGERYQNIEPQEEDCTNTLTDVQKDNLVGEYNYGKLRRLTPVECERLQGFLDDWTKVYCHDLNKYVSDTQRYRQLGNAVTVNVIEYIGSKICHLLTEDENAS